MINKNEIDNMINFEFGTRDYLKGRADQMRHDRVDLARKQATMVRLLGQHYGTELVAGIFLDKPVKPEKVKCCFCGEKIDENPLTICISCHDELSGAVADVEPPTEEEVAASPTEIDDTDKLWKS